MKRLEEVMVKLGFSTDSSMQLTSEDANGKFAPAFSYVHTLVLNLLLLLLSLLFDRGRAFC